MAIKVITSFGILFQKAYRLGQARLVKNPNEAEREELRQAEEDHASYKELCLASDCCTL